MPSPSRALYTISTRSLLEGLSLRVGSRTSQKLKSGKAGSNSMAGRNIAIPSILLNRPATHAVARRHFRDERLRVEETRSQPRNNTGAARQKRRIPSRRQTGVGSSRGPVRASESRGAAQECPGTGFHVECQTERRANSTADSARGSYPAGSQDTREKRKGRIPANTNMYIYTYSRARWIPGQFSQI